MGGDTLVIDSTNFVDTTWFGRGGFFHSADMHMVEKLTRKGDEILYQVVPVQPEMERRRFPLVGKFRPSGGDFQGMGVYRSDVFGEERER